MSSRRRSKKAEAANTKTATGVNTEAQQATEGTAGCNNPYPDAFDVARSNARGGDRNSVREAFPGCFGDAPSETSIVNALLTDNWPQHTEAEITRTIAALQALFETLPGVVNAANLGKGGGMMQPPYTLCGELNRGIAMLRSYRMAAQVVHERDEQRIQKRAVEQHEAMVTDLEKRAFERGMTAAIEHEKEARRARRTRRK